MAGWKHHSGLILVQGSKSFLCLPVIFRHFSSIYPLCEGPANSNLPSAFVNKALLQHSLAYSVGPRPLSHHNGRLEEVWRRPHGLKSGPLQNKLAGPLFIPQPECPNAISSCSSSAQNSPMIPEVTMAESLPTCHLFVFILTGEPQLCVDISCPNTQRTWPLPAPPRKMIILS